MEKKKEKNRGLQALFRDMHEGKIPIPVDNTNPWGNRDKLAARAMQALIETERDADIIAHRAYIIADAMLKWRNQTEITRNDEL